MIQVMVLLLGVATLIRMAPTLPMSVLLSDGLAARPARWLLRRSRQELIAWAIMAALIAFAGEYVLVIGGPQIAIGLAVDLAAYVDAVIAVPALASVARVRAIAAWLRPTIRACPRARAPRVRRARAERKAANDSDDQPGMLAA